MLKVSDAFNSAFAAPDRELRARVTIGKTVYDSDDLTSINYDSGAMTGEQFSIGSTYMNSAKITFSHLVEGLKQLDEVLVEFGVLKPDGAVEYVKMGTFIVDDKIQMDRNNNTTTIECMDRMTMLGGAYVSKLTYPARIKDVAVEIANMAGVKANETSFARLSENKINQPTGYTYRDAIGLIAQFQMGFALFDRDGLLDIRTLQDNSFKIDPNQYFLKGLVKNETFFKLNGISCTVVTTSKDENGNETSKTTVLQSGSSSGAQIKLANNVMTQDVLDRMYEALKFTNYYPFSLNWNGNPAVEAGDWLTVEDLQGNEFKVPNMSYTLTYNGGLTATSKADTSVSSPATYSYGGTISNIVNEIGGRESAEGNHIYEGTEDQKPLFPKEGDLWYKHVGPDTEEWIYKDGKWEFLTSTKPATDAQKAADAAQKEAEEAKKTANESVAAADDAVGKANQAVEDAGFANSTASDAKTAAANAQKDATGALSDAQNALTNSSSAMADSTQARKDSAAAAADATTAKGQAANALGQANTAINNAANALDKFNNMQVGGVNLLLDTDFNNLPQYWTSRAGKVTGTFNGHNIIYYDATAITSDFADVLQQPIYNPSADNRTLPSQWYTLSFYAKGVGKMTSYVYANFVDTSAASYIDGVKLGYTKNDGSNVWDLTDGWTRHTYTFKSKSNFPATERQNVLWRLFKGNEAYICMPKLDAGTLVTDWSPAPEDVQQQFTNIDGELASKVSQTTYNVLAGTVDTVNTLAKQNQSTISTLATKNSVDTVNHTATTAQTLAQQNANELLNKASTNTVNTLTQRVTTAESTLSQTATKAELALTNTDVDKLNDTVASQALDITATADGLKLKADSLTVSDLAGTVAQNSAQLGLTATKADLALTQNDVNDLDDTVNKQATQLALTATKAELQVAQTNADNLKKTVTSNTAGMTANANALKLKADSSTVSTLDGRVSTLSGQLDVQSDLISAKVTANDVTGMLNGYATQTWSEGKISAAKNEISASVETVKQTVDNLQIGGRNLVLNSDFENPIANVANVNSGRGGVSVDYSYQGSRSLKVSLDPTISSNDSGVIVRFSNPQPNSTYTATGWLYSTVARTLIISGYSSTWASRGRLPVVLQAKTWTKFEYHFTTEISVANAGVAVFVNGTTGNDIQPFYIDLVKIEQANVATNWSIAPEDQATVDWTKSQLDITDKKITAGITTVTNTLNNNIASATAGMATTTWTNTQIDAAKTAINLSVEQSITTSENTLNNNIANATKDMATQTWTKGQLSVTNDNVSASVQKLHDAVTGEISTATTDMATKSWTQGKLDLTDSSLTSQISSVQDGLTTKFTALQQTLNGVQITANNAVTQTQYTQLSDQFTTTIANVGAPNLVSMTGWTNVVTTTHAYYTGNQPLYRIDNVSTTATAMARSSRFAIKANTTYTLSFFGFGTSNAKPINVYVLGRKNGETADFTTISLPIAKLQLPPGGGNFTFSGTFTTGAIDNAYVRVDNNGTTDSTGGSIYFTEVQLEEGSVATPYRVSDNQISSQFTQLQKDINLRVKTGDLINQINISPEGILIDGQKVHITGQTSIDNAVIKDAMIADIKADKITAGTLNAANVNVINMNAANITTGTIKGANLSLNLNTGEVVFQHGRIHSTSDNVDVNIDQGYLSTASNNTRVMLKEGQLQLVQPTIFDNSKDPYLEISNSIGGASFNGANIIARDYLVLANRSNSDAFFDAPLDGPETFAGLAVGKTSSDRWKPTRIGGAERGIIMRGGTAYMIDSSFMYKESPEIFVGTDGAGLKPSDRIYINGSYVHITSAYWRTASGSANLMVAQDGALVRSTSASKYKTDIIRTNATDYGDKLLNLPTATWTDIAETKRYQDNPTTQPKPTRNFGMIAEDLADAGLEMLVVRGTDGELEGINYDRIGPALIPVIAKLKNKMEKLEQKLEENQHDKNTNF